MKALRIAPVRPAWVDDVVADLTETERALAIVQARVLAAGMKLREQRLEAPASALNQAYHDAEHVWQHVASARRGLVMSWPDDQEITAPRGSGAAGTVSARADRDEARGTGERRARVDDPDPASCVDAPR